MNAVVATSGSSAVGARRDRPGGGGGVLERHVARRAGTKTCTPLAPLVFTAPARPTSASACAHELRGGHRGREAAALRRVEVEHEVRPRSVLVGPHQRRVVLDRPLVGEPQQRAPVVAQRVGDLALATPRPTRDGAHDPVRRVLRHVLLHERLPGRGRTRITDSGRSRSSGRIRSRDRVEVVDEVALGRVGAVEQRLVEVGELDAVAGLLRLGHQLVTSFRANRQIASTENTAA